MKLSKRLYRLLTVCMSKAVSMSPRTVLGQAAQGLSFVSLACLLLALGGACATAGSPCLSFGLEPGAEKGSPAVVASCNPKSLPGRFASPHPQGHGMDEVSAIYVGIDVSKDRLDMHLRPAGERRAVPRDEAGLEQPGRDLVALSPRLVVLEASGGYELTVAALRLMGRLLGVTDDDNSDRPASLNPADRPAVCEESLHAIAHARAWPGSAAGT